MELPQFLQEIAGNSLCFNTPAFGWLGVSRITSYNGGNYGCEYREILEIFWA